MRGLLLQPQRLGTSSERLANQQMGLYKETHLLWSDVTNELGVLSSLFFVVFGRWRKEV